MSNPFQSQPLLLIHLVTFHFLSIQPLPTISKSNSNSTKDNKGLLAQMQQGRWLSSARSSEKSKACGPKFTHCETRCSTYCLLCPAALLFKAETALA